MDSFFVSQPEPLIVQQVQMQPVFCNQICNGWVSVTAIGGTGPYQYQWLHGDSDCVADSLCAGIYRVEVTDSHNCRTSGYFAVTDSSSYNIAYQLAPLSCTGGCDASITLTTDFSPFDHQVIWNQNPQWNTDSLTDLCAGRYQADISVDNGCSYRVYLQIDEITALQFVNLFVTPPLCYGDSNAVIQTDVIGGTAPYVLGLNGAMAEFPVTGLLPGAYTISAMDAAGCHVESFLEITQPRPVLLSESHVSPPCNDVCTGVVNLSVAGGTVPYRCLWSNGAEGPALEGLCVGTYEVTVTDRNGCVAALSLELTDSTVFPTDISAWCDEDTIYAGQAVHLHSTELGNPFQYSWVPSVGLGSPTASSTVAYPAATTQYVIIVTDEFGCARTDTVSVHVRDVICEEPYVFVPNAFTPNGDGKNDILYVRGEVIRELSFKVYDRWGEKVFETTDMTEGWDGTYRGQACEPGVYDYHLQVTCLGSKRYFKKGNVTLLR